MSPRPALSLPLLAIALAACSNAEEREEAPQPTPELAPEPVRTEAADGSPLTPGSWNVEENADGARASFAEPGGEPLLVLRCDRARKALTLERAGDAAGEGGAFVLDVGGQRARVDMAPGSGTITGYSAEVDGTMPLFAAMGDPAETIRLTAEGTPPLTLPTHAGIPRVLESCR